MTAVSGGWRLALAQAGFGVALGVVAMAGASPGSLALGGFAAIVAFAVIWWPSVGCLVSIVCAAIALAYAEVRWVAVLVAAVCGLLGVLFVLAGNVRLGRGSLRSRLDLLLGSAIAVLGAVLGALVDTAWGWLAVLVPIGAAAIYLSAMLALRTPAAVAAVEEPEQQIETVGLPRR